LVLRVGLDFLHRQKGTTRISREHLQLIKNDIAKNHHFGVYLNYYLGDYEKQKIQESVQNINRMTKTAIC